MYYSSNKCGKEGDVGKIKYTVKNLVQAPTFIETITLDIVGCNDTAVETYMEIACDTYKHTFTKFSKTYFPNIGFYVSSVNGVSETANVTYWEMIEHSTGEQYEAGSSSYIPQPGDHVAWNLTYIWPVFSKTYFPNIGFYVSSVNGVSETANVTYWEMIEHSTGEQYEAGSSSYIPQPGDHVAWNLTYIWPV